MWAPYWIHITGDHLGLSPKICCLKASVVPCQSLCWEALTIERLQLLEVIWKRLSNNIGTQPNCIKLTWKLQLLGILNHDHHIRLEGHLLVSFVKGDLPSMLNGLDILSCHSPSLIQFFPCGQSIPQ